MLEIYDEWNKKLEFNKNKIVLAPITINRIYRYILDVIWRLSILLLARDCGSDFAMNSKNYKYIDPGP